jgi:hypothetical protein
MATSSYASLFGTTGAGQQGSRAGIGTMFGQQAKPQETEEERQQRMQAQGQAPQGPRPVQPQQTFAQLQRQGMARPAPQAPQAHPFQQFAGSQQAQQARTGMLGALQQQLAQPTRFDTEAFQKIRQAQSAQLGAEYQAQQSQLNEELARRGLSASSIGGGRMGDLAGQQARALAQLDAQLLQQAAQTQAQDRLAALQAAQGFSELAGAQDLAQFEANRVAQAAEFQQALQQAQFGQAQTEFERGQALQAAQLAQTGQQAGMELALRERLGLGELTGQVSGAPTLAAQQQAEQRRQFDVQQALQSQLGLGGLAVQQREVDLRAQQLQQEAAAQGRQLTLEEARLAAQQQQFAQTQAQQAAQFGVTTELERDRLAAQQAQFGAQLGFNREELALRGELGRNEQTIAENRLAQEGRLEEARQGIQLKELGQREAQFTQTLNADEQRFVRTLKEQQDARLQQLGISTRQLDMDAARLKQEAELQGRSLTIQEARDAAEVNYRGRALEQEATLAGRRISSEEAMAQAQRQLAQYNTDVQAALQREGITVDRERLAAAQRQFDADLGLRERLGAAELTGTYGGQQTLQAQQAQQNLLIQLAGVLAGGGAGTQAQMPELIKKLYAAFGIPLTGTGTLSTGVTGGGVAGIPSATPTTTATTATLPYEGGTETVRSL